MNKFAIVFILFIFIIDNFIDILHYDFDHVVCENLSESECAESLASRGFEYCVHFQVAHKYFQCIYFSVCIVYFVYLNRKIVCRNLDRILKFCIGKAYI